MRVWENLNLLNWILPLMHAPHIFWTKYGNSSHSGLTDSSDWPNRYNNRVAGSNQIYLVTLRPRQLTQASFLQKNQTLQIVFLISVPLRWHRASVACKNQSL